MLDSLFFQVLSVLCSLASISSDISKVGVWKEARKLSDPELSIQVPHLLDLVLASNAPSTTSKYSYGWARWRRWTQSKQGVSFMPAHPLCIALYLLELTEDALQKNSGCSAIDSALYGIRWAHKIAGLESPTEHPTVIAAAEGAIEESYLSQFNPSNPWILRLLSKSLSIITQL